jgi:hypothetical protein
MWVMRTCKLVVVSLLLCAFNGGMVAAARGGPAAARQWAIVYLHEPTLIGSAIVQGPVIVTHDERQMARGEPCTTVQLFEPGLGPAEPIASFHCTPIRRSPVTTFTIRTRPNTRDGLGCVLTEYQFAGDSEGHGVPEAAAAH